MNKVEAPYRSINSQFNMVFCILCQCSFVGGTEERMKQHEKKNQWRHDEFKRKAKGGGR